MLYLRLCDLCRKKFRPTGKGDKLCVKCWESKRKRCQN